MVPSKRDAPPKPLSRFPTQSHLESVPPGSSQQTNRNFQMWLEQLIEKSLWKTGGVEWESEVGTEKERDIFSLMEAKAHSGITGNDPGARSLPPYIHIYVQDQIPLKERNPYLSKLRREYVINLSHLLNHQTREW